MKEFLVALRRQPAPLIGTFVSLLLMAILVTVSASLVGTGLTLKPSAQRLVDASVVVTGNQELTIHAGQGNEAETDVLGLPTYRRVPASLARTIAAVPGVAAAVPDVAVPVSLYLNDRRVVARSATDASAPRQITGYGWESAALTPVTIKAGHVPVNSNDIAVPAALAQTAGLHVGDTVRLAGQRTPLFTVSGLTTTTAADPAQNFAVYFSDAEANTLYAHPGQADFIGIVAKRGTSASTLAADIHHAPALAGYTVLSGSSIGEAEDPAAAINGANMWQLGTGAGLDVVLIALFIVAGTVALSVAQRARSFALLRAIGATPGQVRKLMMAEQAVLGAVAGVVGCLPGALLAEAVVRGLAAHQFGPATTHAWTNSLTNAWVVVIPVAIGVAVAEIASLAATRRINRPAPSTALGQAEIQPPRRRRVRAIFGLVLLALGIGGGVAAVILPLSASDQLNLILAMLLVFLCSIALLGPLVLAIAAAMFRGAASRGAGRLALAAIRMHPQRATTALVSIALAVTFTGTVYVIDTTQTHAAAVQGKDRLTAAAVVSAPAPGLDPEAAQEIQAQPGVAAVVGLTPTTVFIPVPGNENTSAEAVTVGKGQVPDVLDLKVTAGSLDGFGPGDIALSRLVTGKTAVEAQVGGQITMYLADGTPYRAKVTAIYSQSLGFGDAMIPAGAAGGGHLGTQSVGQVLVGAAPSVSPAAVAEGLAPLVARFPGLSVAGGGAVANAQAVSFAGQVSYANDLILAALAALAGLALVNTLVMATVERRGALRLLSRIGATRRQLMMMTWWQTLILSAAGLLAGIGAAALTVIAATKAMTGTWTPAVSWGPVAFIAGTVLALTVSAMFVPTIWLTARATGSRG